MTDQPSSTVDGKWLKMNKKGFDKMSEDGQGFLIISHAILITG